MNLERKCVIAAAVAAFIAWALITDWIPSLRWIPYAFVAGFLAAILSVFYLVLTTSKGVHNLSLIHI